MSEVNLEVRIGDLTLKNPVMLASGTVGYGDEISEFVDLSRIGAIITKSVSLEPRIGNPPIKSADSEGYKLVCKEGPVFNSKEVIL
jgi:dihydroorotate dehydrogenase (NAD+) catalytic subunit